MIKYLIPVGALLLAALGTQYYLLNQAKEEIATLKQDIEFQQENIKTLENNIATLSSYTDKLNKNAFELKQRQTKITESISRKEVVLEKPNLVANKVKEANNIFNQELECVTKGEC